MSKGEVGMNLFELFILAVGLSMDAFAVAVCKGLSLKKITARHPVTVGLYFGIFQAGMPLIGFILGSQFSSKISSIDHWIAFILLGAIGINMIREALNNQEDECSKAEQDTAFSFKNMIVLALATSIDALAIGITFAFLKVSIIPAVSFIGIITFIISAAGVFIGNFFGAKYKSKAEFSGGIILVCLGFKILMEHLEIFS
jgi:putative Mn2+ efflux pump MntP